MQELAVSQLGCCGEMVRAGENRHFFPLTSLQIGYVFRGILSLVLGFCHAIVGSLPTIRLPASGCQLAGEVLVLAHWSNGAECFWRSFFFLLRIALFYCL